MISINLVHSLILKTINENYPAMAQRERARLAQTLARGLHPVIVEQIQREAEKAGGYPSRSNSLPVEELPAPPSGPAPGANP